jgi:hypothetical protein
MEPSSVWSNAPGTCVKRSITYPCTFNLVARFVTIGGTRSTKRCKRPARARLAGIRAGQEVKTYMEACTLQGIEYCEPTEDGLIEVWTVDSDGDRLQSLGLYPPDRVERFFYGVRLAPQYFCRGCGEYFYAWFQVVNHLGDDDDDGGYPGFNLGWGRYPA